MFDRYFDKYTLRAKDVLRHAQEEAKRLNYTSIAPEHIFLGLLKKGDGIAIEVLLSLGISLDEIKAEIEKAIKSGGANLTLGDLPFSPSAKKVIELASEESQRLNHNYIGTEHLLLGIVREGENLAAKLLSHLGGDLERIREETVKSQGGFIDIQPNQKKSNKTKNLDQFARDLTKMAQEDKLDPVIGRDKEIERIIQVLSRRTKNNPVLIGDPGVGKTAIVEGLAQRINEGNVPELLTNKRVVGLDLAAIVAGTKYRGEFEERLKKIVKEIIDAKNVIVFIDEIHNLVGTGAAEGAIDAANILKPALARGELQCVGATTLDEYRKYVEKDAALERRFQVIFVDQPTVEQTVEILKGLRDRYEAHHKIKFTDDALSTAAKLANQYISDRFLPDKAIDLIDEAGSRTRLKTTIMPDEIKEQERELEKITLEKEASITAQEFEKSAFLRDRERELKEKIEQLKSEWTAKGAISEAVVTKVDIEEIVSRWTGIPAIRLAEDEAGKLLNMEDKLHERLIGQDEAVKAISKSIRRSRTGISNPKRPTGSFLFLGPSGVGKTELARTLAEYLFGNEEALIRIDMSEFMEKFSVSRLIGAPPGYVGYEEGGQLTEKVRRKPYSVVLLDEIEKAHPDVFNILLQVLEDGILSDNLGHQVNFKNTVIIMTSNVGARSLTQQKSMGFKSGSDEQQTFDEIKDKLLEELKKTFNPEFLNRIDETIVFHQLRKVDVEKIIRLMMKEVEARLADKNIRLEMTSACLEFLVTKGYDPAYGARMLRRTIQRYIEDRLSEEILKGQVKSDSRVVIDVSNEELEVKSY